MSRNNVSSVEDWNVFCNSVLCTWFSLPCRCSFVVGAPQQRGCFVVKRFVVSVLLQHSQLLFTWRSARRHQQPTTHGFESSEQHNLDRNVVFDDQRKQLCEEWNAVINVWYSFHYLIIYPLECSTYNCIATAITSLPKKESQAAVHI